VLDRQPEFGDALHLVDQHQPVVPHEPNRVSYGCGASPRIV
jgi:hypothetical protein